MGRANRSKAFDKASDVCSIKLARRFIGRRIGHLLLLSVVLTFQLMYQSLGREIRSFHAAGVGHQPSLGNELIRRSMKKSKGKSGEFWLLRERTVTTQTCVHVNQLISFILNALSGVHVCIGDVAGGSYHAESFKSHFIMLFFHLKISWKLFVKTKIKVEPSRTSDASRRFYGFVQKRPDN